MTTSVPSPSWMADLALSDCTYLKNFTHRDFEEFDEECGPGWADPNIIVRNNRPLPDGSFVWTEEVTNPRGNVDNVVDVTRIPGLLQSDIATFTRDGVPITPIYDPVAGGVIFDANNPHSLGPGYAKNSVCTLSFTPAAPPGTYRATAELRRTNHLGPLHDSDDFQVVVSLAALGPLILTMMPREGSANGGTYVTIYCRNLDQVSGLGVNPEVWVGGSKLTGTAIIGPTGDTITGMTSPMLSGNRDSQLVEIRPSIDPPFSLDLLWDWVVVDWDETGALGTWGSVARGIDWVEGLRSA